MLAKTEVRILKRTLEHGPVNAYQLNKTGLSLSTLFRKLPSLVKRGYLEVEKKDFGTKMISKYYQATVRALMSLSLVDPKYIQNKLRDLHDFFSEHGLVYELDALNGMLKIWIYFAQRAPRIDGRIPYLRTELPDTEFLSNISRGILLLLLGRISPFAQTGEVSFLTPNSLEVALRVEGKLSQEETEAVLLALYGKGIHFENSEMALRSEALWEEKFGTSRKRDFWLGGFFPKEGNLFRVGAKLNPDILRDDIASGKKQSLDVLKGIQDVVVTKIHRSKTEA